MLYLEDSVLHLQVLRWNYYSSQIHTQKRASNPNIKQMGILVFRFVQISRRTCTNCTLNICHENQDLVSGAKNVAKYPWIQKAHLHKEFSMWYVTFLFQGYQKCFSVNEYVLDQFLLVMGLLVLISKTKCSIEIFRVGLINVVRSTTCDCFAGDPL